MASRDVETPNLVGRAAGGAGVTVFGIDTGILTTHNTFGGRASWGATYGGYASKDGNGHGTRASTSHHKVLSAKLTVRFF